MSVEPGGGLFVGDGEGGGSPAGNIGRETELRVDLMLAVAGEGVKRDDPSPEPDGDDAARRGVIPIPKRPVFARTGEVWKAWKREANGDLVTGDDWAKIGSRPGVGLVLL